MIVDAYEVLSGDSGQSRCQGRGWGRLGIQTRPH